MAAITHEQALDLFQLPRKLGVTAAGDEITTNVGRFGPYVKYGAKYVSLKTDDPYEITPERALEVIREKEVADANRLILDFPAAGIQVLNGRYGPYITDKQRNAKIPKDKDPKSLTVEECQTLLAAAPVRTFGKWGRKQAKGAAAKPASKAGKKAAVSTEAPAGAQKAPPLRLAAKGSKAPAKKRAPVKPTAAGKDTPIGKPTGAKSAAAKRKPAAKKSRLKKPS
jgi:DNA topoisomerase I